MQVTRQGNLGGAQGSGQGAKPAQSLSYLRHDHLGPVGAVSDEAGSVIERMAYDPWGKRRNTNGLADTTDTVVGLTLDRGYTMHEHLDEMGLIHMNGRVYDPLIGRFMSADPFIQAPGNLQSHNRYAYVTNNPLALTDPSGYFFKKLMEWGDKITAGLLAAPLGPLGGSRVYHSTYNYLQGSGGYQLKSAALGFVSLFCGWGAPACNAGFQAALAKGYGASDSEANRAAGIGFISSLGNQLAGGIGAEYGVYGWQHYLAHAASGCITSVASGGQCGRGAIAGVVGLGATEATSGWGSSFGVMVARFGVTVVAGGIASQISGGKFSDGARTAAYGYLFNHLGGHGGSTPEESLSPALAADGKSWDQLSTGEQLAVGAVLAVSGVAVVGPELAVGSSLPRAWALLSDAELKILYSVPSLS
jgi:RHS repeat-associated protein